MEHTQSPYPNLTIFIGGLPGLTRKKDLYSIFSKHGKITSIVIETNRNSKFNKGYALIKFADLDGYNSALKLPEMCFMSRTISCQPYLNGEELSNYLEDLNSRRLFIKYIPKSYDNLKLESVFEKYGKIDFAYVVKDPTSLRSKGYGYVTFQDAFVARKVESLRSIKIKGKKKMKIFPYKRRAQVNSNNLHGEKEFLLQTRFSSLHDVIKKINYEKPGTRKWLLTFRPKDFYKHFGDNLRFNKSSKIDMSSKNVQLKKEVEEKEEMELLRLPFILPLIANG